MKNTKQWIATSAFAIAVFSCISQTQLAPNGEFESWTDFTPDQWYVTIAPGSILMINQVGGNGGGSALRGDVIYDIELESYLSPLVQTGPEESGTFPVDAQYTWCLFDYKFHNVGDDSFYIYISMLNDSDMEIGNGTASIANEVTTYTTYSLPIGYVGTPTKCRITFVITDADEEPEEAGSYFVVDNVRLSETQLNTPILPTVLPMQATLFPNPTAAAPQLSITLQRASLTEITITDNCGNLVQHISAGILHAGENHLEIETHTLSAGIYIVEAVSDCGKLLKRLEVRK